MPISRTNRKPVPPPAKPAVSPLRRIRSPRRPLLLVTAGPTHEPIDAVRYLGNQSSGAMGIALADAAAEMGCRVELLLGPTSRAPAHSQVNVRRFQTTAELQSLLTEAFPRCGILIMAAAVADYRPIPTTEKTPAGKIPRFAKGLTLRLEATPDLLQSLKPLRKPGQTVVGFALESESTMLARAKSKLVRKGLDLIVANPLETMNSPNVSAIVLDSAGIVMQQGPAVSKKTFAKRLMKTVLTRHRATLGG